MSAGIRYVIGVDGGGTKTEVAVIDTLGRVRGIGLGGPSSFDKTSQAAAKANIAAAVASARSAASLGDAPIDAVFFGMAGVTSAHDRATVHAIGEALKLAPPDHIGVDHDLRAALAGGLCGRPGIVVIAGTGSSCYGINAAGESWKAGGYGTMISDEGSSYWLGVRAIRAAAMIHDGRLPASAAPLLYAPVMRQLGIDSIDDVMHRLHVAGIAPADVAAFAPLLIEAARQGDAHAIGVLREGMQALAFCVHAVAQRLRMQAEPCACALVGGVFRNGALVIEPLREAVTAQLPLCDVRMAELPPVLGAGILALQRLGVAITPTVIDALRA